MPEMAAPSLWAPGICWFLLQENLHAIKFLVLGGGIWFFWEGGGAEVPILIFWAQ